MRRIVAIDRFPEAARAYRHGYAVVAVDVIRATTTVVTAVASGRRCFPVASLEEARAVAAGLPHPLLAGEALGEMPDFFEMNNSPAALARRADTARPLVLLTSSGTRLLREAGRCERAFAACLRNYSAQTAWLTAAGMPRVVLIGAGTHGEFREEDQLCCAWMARDLMKAGYAPADSETARIVERWRGASAAALLCSRSVDYLRRTGQLDDLRFILERVDDLDAVFSVEAGEVVAAAPETWTRGAGEAAA